MARPPSRRPGHNRKAQYSLFASYVVAVTGAVVGLLLVVVAIFDPTGFAAIRTGAAELTRPMSTGLRHMVSGAASLDEVLELGRASCRERVWTYVEIWVFGVTLKKKKKE